MWDKDVEDMVELFLSHLHHCYMRKTAETHQQVKQEE